MYDFRFSVPTEIIFGTDCEKQAGALMRPWAERVLMLYGSERIFNGNQGEKSLGLRLMESLQDAGCSVFCYGGVKPNADADFIDSAIEVVRREHIQGILAVGGGSVIDTAKAVSAGCCYNGSVMSLYENGGVYPEVFLPIGAVVTMPASASESNEMSVISHGKTGRKIARPFKETKPKFALLNPALTTGISPFQTASGGFDIFAHAFERYFDLNRNSRIFDALTVSLMRQVISILPQVLENPEDLDLRGEMMVAANIAHNDMLGPGGDFACHEISHVITEHFGLAHGAALALIIPAWCEFAARRKPERLAAFFRQVWDTEGADDQTVIQKGIETLRSFIQKIGLPASLDDHGDVSENMLDMMAKEAAGQGGFVGFGCIALSEKEIKEILQKLI